MNFRLQKLLSPLCVTIITAVAGVACFGAVACMANADSSFLVWYRDKLRGDLFNGSLTMSGFLVTVATFIVITMKEKVYDQAPYRENAALLDELRPKARREDLYTPLRQLTALLALATSACLLCTLFHVTFVFLPTPWPVATCAMVAGAALSLTVFAVVAAYANFMFWLAQSA